MSENTRKTTVSFDELLTAFEMGNFMTFDGVRPSIDLDAGKIHVGSDDFEIGDDDETEVEEDGDLLPLPSKYDLNLGKQLVFAFADPHMSEADADKVYSFFTRKGGYRRFKDFLDRRSMLETWYEFEDAATKEALRAWCEENGITLTDD
jgi:hypothetical protein